MSLFRRPAAFQQGFFVFTFLYTAFGVQSPFVPILLQERGIEASLIGFFLAAGTAVKLVAAPIAGRAGDRFNALGVAFFIAAIGSALASLMFIESASVVALLVVILAHALFTGPLAPLADAIGLRVAGESSARYGLLRGVGSAAFIFGVVVSGQFVSGYGTSSAFVANAVLLTAAAGFALVIHGERASRERKEPEADRHAFRELLRIREFRLVIIVSGLILGSHALHDGFTMIRWREAGITPDVAAPLWAIAVGAEVLVFFFVGGALITRIGARGACLVACCAALVRWSAMALTASPLILMAVQPLHGLTFALLHLACMDIIARSVPSRMFGTAQGLYATMGAGVSSVIVTALAGVLYGRMGGGAFWVMAVISSCALPFILRLKEPEGR